MFERLIVRPLYPFRPGDQVVRRRRQGDSPYLVRNQFFAAGNRVGVNANRHSVHGAVLQNPDPGLEDRLIWSFLRSHVGRNLLTQRIVGRTTFDSANDEHGNLGYCYQSTTFGNRLFNFVRRTTSGNL